MTEAEWLACEEPLQMYQFLWEHHRLSQRKERLFCVAVCNGFTNPVKDQRVVDGLLKAEQYADGLLSESEFGRNYSTVLDACMVGRYDVFPSPKQVGKSLFAVKQRLLA